MTPCMITSIVHKEHGVTVFLIVQHDLELLQCSLVIAELVGCHTAPQRSTCRSHNRYESKFGKLTLLILLEDYGYIKQALMRRRNFSDWKRKNQSQKVGGLFVL
uniref:Uncharacterized protein n=1 Tax=Cacopsylla melanoneura TaxID=428564 RepID=A0A8D9E6S4_9HEMI